MDLQAVESASIIEAAFVAKNVDISIHGDWEDVQIELGLLQERLTPAPNYQPLLSNLFGPLLAGDITTPSQPRQKKSDRPSKKKAKVRTKRGISSGTKLGTKRKKRQKARQKRRKRR